VAAVHLPKMSIWRLKEVAYCVSATGVLLSFSKQMWLKRSQVHYTTLTTN